MMTTSKSICLIPMIVLTLAGGVIYISWRTRCGCCISTCKLSVTAVEKGHNAVLAWMEKKKGGSAADAEAHGLQKPLEEGAQSAQMKPTEAQKSDMRVVQLHAESAGTDNAKGSHPPQSHVGISVPKKAKKKHHK